MDMKEIIFDEETEKLAIKLAAFQILKDLSEEGVISNVELRYIADKNGIDIV